MNPFRWSFRASFAALALVCVGLLSYAYYAQFVLKLEPCPLCILQRVAFIGFLVVALLAAIHAPRGAIGRAVYGVMAVLMAMVGVGIAGRHVWLQHLPADQVPACGPGLEYMLDAFPLSKTLKMAFTGSGECAKIEWQFLGLSMPEWTLICFIALALAALWLGLLREPRRG